MASAKFEDFLTLKMFLWQANVGLTMVAMVAYARTVTEYIPGSGCGTFNTIKILKRDPSVQELANGCIYVMKEVTSFQPQGISKIQYMKLSNYIVATYYQSPTF